MVANFWRVQAQKWSVGVDVGEEYIKLICLSTKERSYQLMAYGLFKRSDHHSIRSALRHPAIRTGDIRVSIQDPTTTIRKIELPLVPKQELPEVAKWAIRDALKAPFEDFVFRYHSVQAACEKTDEKGSAHVFLALEKEKIEQRLIQLKKLGFVRPSIVEPHIHSLANTIGYNYEPEKKEQYALIDIGEALAFFSVVSAEGLLFARVLAGASVGAFISKISRDQGITLEEAEKQKTSILEPSTEQKPDTIIRQFLSELCVKIQDSLDAFHLQYPKRPITQLLLAGGGSRLSNLRKHLEDTFQISASSLDPYQKIDTTRFDEENIDCNKERFGIALGLAL